ncbi:Ubiquinone/menaquinone biosynthesis C-methyltransferase UbiE [Candidatus Xenohaliotis californiensis]|uniref:Ubiquinone/menaquinone biosynthesis C-methyltransferase UbiE n=1 Tax=Candidatus Xenohaliotis californiensis TaxID=84677 RepID=A0ABP0EW73_9RICK|nr:Ubiquinone/menaquinone biosynthesis C-methyltransferase UbiE [Candidatus Xenohaliotis californiensis]
MYSVFGFQRIKNSLKRKLVDDIFCSVSKKYDLMNDLMSFGIHRVWKKQMIEEIYPLDNKIILDVAGGTGDIAALLKNIGNNNMIIVCDINAKMMQVGRKKFESDDFIEINDIVWINGDAETLPIKSNAIDFYLISFGIRNFNNINAALLDAYRVIQPGGKFVCLEFSDVANPLFDFMYKKYLDKIIPFIGSIVAKDKDAYQYLADSIQTFPSQDQFASMIEDVGFIDVDFKSLSLGIAAIHTAFKPV